MAQHKGNKSKTAPPYSADAMALRYVCGLILVALGVLIFLSVVVEMAGDVFAGTRLVCRGLAGGLAFLLPVLPIWGGVLVIISAQRKAPSQRTLMLAGLLYLLLLAIADLIATTGSPAMPLMSYIYEYNLTRMSSPGSFEAFLARAYDLGTRTGMGGGLFGMLLAWPLWKLMDVIPSAILCFLLSGVDVVFLLRLDTKRMLDKLRQRGTMKKNKQEQEQQALQAQELNWQREMAARNAAQARQHSLPAPAPMAGYPAQQPDYPGSWGDYMPPNVPAQPGYTQGTMSRPAEVLRPVASTPVPNQNGVVVGFQPTGEEHYTIATGEMYQEQISTGHPDGWRLGDAEQEPPRKSRIFGGKKAAKQAAKQASKAADTVESTYAPPRTAYSPAPEQPAYAPMPEQPVYAPMPAQPAYTDAPAARFRQPMAVPDDSPTTRTASWRTAEPEQLEEWPPRPRTEETPITHKLRARQQATIPSPEDNRGAAPSPADMPPWEDAPATSPRRQPMNDETQPPRSRDAVPTRPATSAPARVPVVTSEPPRETWEPELKLPPRKAQPDPAQVEMELPPPYIYPNMSLLKSPEPQSGISAAEDELRSRRLEETLQSFKIPAKVRHVTHGPAISRFELEIAAGIRVNKVTELDRNIAMNMEVKSVRIEAPIPGKSLVGVEVPNRKVSLVTLREVLETDEMRAAKSPLSVALGKDIAGMPIICDLAKMPHLLIAGATGSGKSVCVNTIINSILFRCSPQEVRLILVDPKVVELQCYNGVPHLLIPVVSDPHKAAGALEWAVAEMMERYKRFEGKGVRDITGFNNRLADGEESMPRIVIVIDELADLMMTCRKDVEDRICRLAQLARAAGIHLIIATQRPSVDVITGLIKANFPSRIAFKVSSFIDSRTILDRPGAEKLLGHGDMLYLPNGEFTPLRVQGCFLNDNEVNRITDFIRQNSRPDYDANVMEQLEHADQDVADAPDDLTAESDPNGDMSLLTQAIEMTVQDGQTSTSMIQRRLRVGYARAGRLVDEMEKRGIVSAKDGAKPRMCLISREEYEQMKLSGGLDE